MAIPHASPGQVINVRPLNDLLANTKTFSIFKSQDLQLIRLVLKAGESFPSHSVDGEITIHCIEGSIYVSCNGPSTVLAAGEMLFLERNVEHAVDAVEDASALVTIAIKP
ncbi:MAG: cupin domain-containing protein [Comamonas sp.]|nr:cupin domain-containing protein [Comamonas sp.]